MKFKKIFLIFTQLAKQCINSNEFGLEMRKIIFLFYTFRVHK